VGVEVVINDFAGIIAFLRQHFLIESPACYSFPQNSFKTMAYFAKCAAGGVINYYTLIH
jgi:hypothetical protein